MQTLLYGKKIWFLEKWEGKMYSLADLLFQHVPTNELVTNPSRKKSEVNRLGNGYVSRVQKNADSRELFLERWKNYLKNSFFCDEFKRSSVVDFVLGLFESKTY